jgi:hypothetical protein
LGDCRTRPQHASPRGSAAQEPLNVSAPRLSGNHEAMKKFRYAILGWIVWKFAKRRAKRKLHIA